MAVRQPERRQAPWWIPMVAVMISAIGLVLGPCFGAGVAVIGTYVAMQTRSAVTDTKLELISGDVKQIKETLKERAKPDAELEVTVSKHEGEITAIKSEVSRLSHVIDTVGGMTAADANNKTKK